METTIWMGHPPGLRVLPDTGCGRHRGIWPLLLIAGLLALLMSSGPMLRAVDPQAGVLDPGILSLLVFAGLSGLLVVVCSRWLLELLWEPFQPFRKQLRDSFRQLSSWRQTLLYFGCYFLLLYALIWLLAIVL